MSVLRGSPRIFRDGKAVLAESLVWDAATRDLLWCDIAAGVLYRSPLDGPADGSADTSLAVPPPLASFHRARAGGYVASLGDRIVLAADDGTILRELGTVAHAHDDMRMNEGKVDPAGRWVSGSMDTTEATADGAIYSFDADGGHRVIRDGLIVANGFEWSLDGTRMYYGDTGRETIFVADYGSDGQLGEPEVFHSGRSHDGLTIDVDGYLWSGIYGAGLVVRYAPDGREDLTIELPAPNITSVAFGGDDLSILFVASARENLAESDLREHSLSGGVFSVDTATHGKPPREFG